MTCMHGRYMILAVVLPILVPVVFAGTSEEYITGAPLSADQIVAAVNERDEGKQVTRTLIMNLTDRRGKIRSRTTINYRKQYEGEVRTVLFFLGPANIRDTAFLIWDYKEYGQEDDQWLYLPALRKVRRVSAGHRGDYFFGTDFTYEDLKLDGKLEPLDYRFTLLGGVQVAGVEHYHLEAVPKTADIAEELGYSRNEIWVNAENWLVTKAVFWDTKGNLLKTLNVDEIKLIDKIWSKQRMTIVNHQTGHSSDFVFSAVDYSTPVTDDMFSKSTLQRGR
jgi:uncharacterized protein